MMSLVGAFYYLRVVRSCTSTNRSTPRPSGLARPPRLVLSANGLAIAVFGLMPRSSSELRGGAGWLVLKPRPIAPTGAAAPVFTLQSARDNPETQESGVFDKDPALAEKRLDGEQVFDGRLLQVIPRHRHACPTAAAPREYIKHPGAVVIVAVLPDGKLVFERQFRYPVGEVFLELPAGKLDPDETLSPAPSANCSKRPATAPGTGNTSA